MSDRGDSSLPRVPWSRAALAYGAGLSLVELACIAAWPPAFRALVIADAAMGWTVALAAWQGVRAVPHPPPRSATVIASIATGHWVAALAWCVATAR